jgi:uncharacterized protein (TIRG00374 family)
LLVGFTIVVLASSVILVRAALRRRILGWITELVHHGLERLTPQRRPHRFRLLRFQRNVSAGVEFLLQRPADMVAPTAYIVLDWVFTLLTLHTAFVAIGYPIPPSYVIAGFAIGMFFSVVSLVPAGLGILEGSMAAVFASLGVPLEQSVIAILIFRVAYYVLPTLTSLALVRPTLYSSGAA